MKGTSTQVADGAGWRVRDLVCTAGPHDRPYEERHGSVCMALVLGGTFRYRAAQGSALLGPGAVLLGNAGACYECGHEHGAGDRCLSFELAPETFESVVAAVPGAPAAFARAHLPPSPRLMPLVAQAEAARDDKDDAALEELAWRLAGAVLSVIADDCRPAPAPSARDQRRVAAALRAIEAQAEAPLPVAGLAREAGMSPYHFLRTFRQLVGMTPHQFVLRTRLHRAAVRLCRSDEAISEVAFGAGFNDLSTFNRRFRRIMGESPSAYRARRT
jgi:AraC-like DNA-binding protein